MTHDPMCPWRGYERAPGDVCWRCDTCRLIAEVRADQDRRRAAAELTRLAQEMGMIP